MLSLDYATNMFYVKFKNNILDKNTGLKYREKILKPGSTKDSLVLVRDFLEEDLDIVDGEWVCREDEAHTRDF